MTLTYSRNKVRRNCYVTNILKTKLVFMHVAAKILFFKRKNYRGEWLNSFTWKNKDTLVFLDKLSRIWVCCSHFNHLSKTCNNSIIWLSRRYWSPSSFWCDGLGKFPCNTSKFVSLMIVFKIWCRFNIRLLTLSMLSPSKLDTKC